MEDRDIPLELHTKKPVPGAGANPKWHGAFEWTPEFTAYIKDVLPSDVIEARRAWREWWTDDYVVARLAAHLKPDELTAVLRWVRDHDHPVLIAREFRHSVGWLVRQKCRAVRIVRQHYLPYTTGPHPDRRHLDPGS